MNDVFAKSELSETIYLLVDDNGELQKWTDDLGVARTIQAANDYSICRFTHDPMRSKPWEGVDQDSVRSLGEYQ